MNDVFLDTSIQVARTIHSPEKKKKIENRIETYANSCTSLIVQQEYKRRVLKEAQYLLNLLEEKKSIKAVNRHIIDHLSNSKRKQIICLQLIQTHFSENNDEAQVDRAKSILRNLIRLGISDFEDSVSQIIEDSGCAAARTQIIEKIPYKQYDFGHVQCKKYKSTCNIIEFLQNRKYDLLRVQERLKLLPDNQKSNELKKAELFIERVLLNLNDAHQENPCLEVGDLMIALESVNCKNIYTMNIKESRHLCRALNQNMIICPNSSEKDDDFYNISSPNWDEQHASLQKQSRKKGGT